LENKIISTDLNPEMNGDQLVDVINGAEINKKSKFYQLKVNTIMMIGKAMIIF
jgi:hypothetical protein